MRHSLKQALQHLGLLRGVFRIYETARTFKLDRQRTGQRSDLAADGLPIPPSKLLVQIGGDTNVPAFLAGGRHIAESIREILTEHAVDLAALHAMLDFGCGCGRMIRQWRALSDTIEIHGTDYNPEMIRWCQQHLDFARFEHNRLEPPLGYADNYFDFVYAFSVFTHLPEKQQAAWLDELTRIVKPGGHLLLTTQGEGYLDVLTSEERNAFASGKLVVRYESVAGTNLCAAFHPERYIREKWGHRLRIVDYRPRRLTLDVTLLRRSARI